MIVKMQKVKVGVVGTGFIGPLHIEALRRLGIVDVVALADINEEVASQKAKQLNIGKYYGDYKDLINNKEIDVVHVCTPNFLHYRISKEAMLANKHVVCEKPLAMNSTEADDLVRIAREKKLANAVHFNLRFYPLVHQAKKMIEEGELGRIFAVNGSYQQDWLLYETDFNWRLEPEFSGDTRALADIGSHWLDMVEYITGAKINALCSDFAIFHKTRKKPLKPINNNDAKFLNAVDYKDVEIKTEDYATVLLRFNNGAHGSMTVNQAAAGRKNRLYFEIYGSKKSIGWDSEKPNELWIGRRDGNNEILMKDPSLLYPYSREIVSYPGGHNEGFPDTSKQMFRKFYEYILDGGHLNNKTPDFATFESGQRELFLGERILKSAKEEKWLDA